LFAAIEASPQHQSLDTFTFWLHCARGWLKEESARDNDGQYKTQLESEFTHSLRAWIAQWPIDKYDELLQSSFWKDLSSSEESLIESLCSSLLENDCIDFIFFVLDKETARRSPWPKSFRALDCAKTAVGTSSLDNLKRLFLWQNSKVKEGEQLNREMFMLITDYGLIGRRTREHLEFVVAFLKTHPGEYFGVQLTSHIINDLACIGDLSNLQYLREHLIDFGVVEEFPDNFEEERDGFFYLHCLEGALRGFQVNVLEYLLPHLKKLPSDDVGEYIGSAFRDFLEHDEDEFLELSPKITQCFKFIYDRFPASFRAVLCDREWQGVVEFSHYLHLGDVSLFEFFLDKGIEFDRSLLTHYFLDEFTGGFTFPNKVIDVAEFLLAKGFKIGNMEIGKADFSGAICRSDALRLLRFLETHFGKALFNLFDDRGFLSCIEFGEMTRVTMMIHLPDFIDALRFAYVRSSIVWKPKFSARIGKINVRYIREEFQKLEQELSQLKRGDQ